MEINGQNHDEKFKIIKDRSDLLRNIKDKNLQKENEIIGEKILTK